MNIRYLYRISSGIVSIIFILTILVPLLVWLLSAEQEISLVEKRSLAKTPKMHWSVDGVSEYLKQLDIYYADHFGLRKILNSYYRFVKYNLGDSPASDVILGKDGWLYLGSIKKGYNEYADPIGDVRNINLYSKSELRKFANYMMALESWLNQKGIAYVFVIAPNKHSIYYENLPDYIYKENEFSAMDQLVEYLGEHTHVTVVDLRPTFFAYKNELQLYYKTDTHWNHYAANLAQYEIMLEIQKIFPGKIKAEKYNLKERYCGGGDLAFQVGIKNEIFDIDPMPVFKGKCSPETFPGGIDEKRIHTIFCNGQNLNALIFRDSFFIALKPYFERKFEKSTYIWDRLSYDYLNAYANDENLNVVVEEWVERTLPFVPARSQGIMKSYNKKLFESSSFVVFRNEFSSLKFNSHVKIKSELADLIAIQCTGISPIINFPVLPFKSGGQYVVHIKAKISVDSDLKLFYSDIFDSGYPFDEQKSENVDVIHGENDIYILLDHTDLGGFLRLDPISEKGEIVINEIEIRKVENSMSYVN